LNVAIGIDAGFNFTTASNNIVIGANVLGNAGESGKIRIGKQGTQTATYIAGIYGKTVASATKVGVMIDSTGKLGTVVSSARFKEAIKPMNEASEALLQLKPVTFRYRHELDPDGVPQFGLIAEQVEKVNPDLVVRDQDGKVNTVRYEAVNAMLLNEFLKEHRTVQEQGRIVQEQEARLAKDEAIIAKQQKQIEALTTGLQKVSDQVELRKPLPQLVSANH
jgi:endosialidase-like protein